MEYNPSRRRSFESLRKEAKRWLASLDNPDFRERLRKALGKIPDSPTLRDVQLALARENGFLGWTDLKRGLDPDPQRVADAIALYETKAHALLDAYRTGTREALERHYALTWHRREWKAMRSYVQLDLGKRGPNPDEIDITLDDARYLIALEHGAENWDELRANPLRPMRLNLLGSVIHGHGQITNDTLERISHLGHVTSLQLSNSKAVSDEGIRHLARMQQLQELDLSQTGITDQSLEVIGELPNLESLSLVFTRVTDNGLHHLLSCRKLRRLNLMWTNTGDGAIRAVAGNTHLTHLWSGNNVTDEGLAAIHQLPVFKTWRDANVDIKLLDHETQPNQLTLRGRFTERGFANLRGLDGLFGLGVASSIPVTVEGVQHLASLPNLGWLSIDAKDEWMSVLADMPALRFLGMQDTTAGDAGFVALSRSKTIENIWGRRCHNLRSRGFIALSKMPRLQRLSVSCLNVEDAALASLPDFPSLRELMPIDILDAGYRHIGKCADLESLVLMYCRDTTDAATEHLTGLVKLKNYFNSYTTITDRTPEILSGMNSLETVTFDACHNLTNDGIARLAQLPRLRELRVSGNGLTRDVVKAFPSRVAVLYSPAGN